MEFLDAHNHLQDERLAADREGVVRAARAAGVVRMVVNGSCEEDWPEVAALAAAHPDLVLPAFGCHPWHLRGRTSGWQGALERQFASHPGAVVGEIGIDRWILDQPEAARLRGLGPEGAVPMEEQEAVFVWQLRFAAERNLPATVHCLQAWGRLLELLRSNPRPAVGFLLHSYGGPAEMVETLARLGAYFGFPGYFAHPRKARQCEVFRRVPADRLLVETDAPDQAPPDGLVTHRVAGGEGVRGVNHPANLPAIQGWLARRLGVEEGEFAARIAANFRRLFPSPGLTGRAGFGTQARS